MARKRQHGRGEGILHHTSRGMHHYSKVHTHAISTTLRCPHTMTKCRLIAAHLPHHATVDQTAALMAEWGQSMPKHDANETFTATAGGAPSLKSRRTDPGAGLPGINPGACSLKLFWLETTALGILVQTCEDAARRVGDCRVRTGSWRGRRARNEIQEDRPRRRTAWNLSRRMFPETLLAIKWMLWLDTTALGILVQTCEDAARNQIQAAQAWGWTPWTSSRSVRVGDWPGQDGQRYMTNQSRQMTGRVSCLRYMTNQSGQLNGHV